MRLSRSPGGGSYRAAYLAARKAKAPVQPERITHTRNEGLTLGNEPETPPKPKPEDQ